MALQFRNIDVSPSDPVDSWGVEGLVTVIERGGALHWARIARAIEDGPDSAFQAELVEALNIADSPGVTALLKRALNDAVDPDRAEVKRRLRQAWRYSGLTQKALAEAADTSRPRITAYLSGAQAPNARVAARIERVARQAAKHQAPGLGLTTSVHPLA